MEAIYRRNANLHSSWPASSVNQITMSNATIPLPTYGQGVAAFSFFAEPPSSHRRLSSHLTSTTNQTLSSVIPVPNSMKGGRILAGLDGVSEVEIGPGPWNGEVPRVDPAVLFTNQFLPSP